MTTNYLEKESSKKKYLAPLVVIMLCLVAITGAAYAYSTSVTGNGNIAGNYIVIDMYSSADDNAGTAKFNVDSNAVKVYAETDKTGTPYDYKGFVEENTKLTFSTYVKINTNLAATQKFKLTQLTADDWNYTPSTTAGQAPCSITLSNMQITAVGDEGTVDTELAGETFYKVTITCNVVAGENDGSVGSYETLAALKTAVTNLQYSTLTITLKATEVTPGA